MSRNKIVALFWLAVFAIVIGCGGGGGGTGVTGATIIGRVLQVSTGGAPNPQASVQVGTTTVLTDVGDGSFTIPVPQGTTSLTIDTRSASGVWTFTIPAASGTVDVGDLWVGPDRVTLRGRVLSSTDSTPVSGAIIAFGGRTGTTNATGNFSISEVAYSVANQTAFWGIVGSARATGYFRNEFTASPNTAVAGVVTVNDVLLTPEDGNDPPPPPYNLWGQVLPSAQAPGTVVTLKLGGVAIRRFNVGGDGKFTFWVPPGTYQIEAVKGALNGTASATVATTSQTVRRDVTLN